MSLDTNSKTILDQLYNKYVLGMNDELMGALGKDGGKMSNELVEGLGKVADEVKKLQKPEPTSLDKALESFLSDGVDPRVKAAKDKYLNMSTNEQARLKETNPELYNAMFPKEEVSIPKPANYDAFKELVMSNENDITKLPYNARLYAMTHDKEFADYITVADASLMAKQTTDTKNPVAKKYQEGLDTKRAEREAAEQNK